MNELKKNVLAFQAAVRDSDYLEAVRLAGLIFGGAHQLGVLLFGVSGPDGQALPDAQELVFCCQIVRECELDVRAVNGPNAVRGLLNPATLLALVQAVGVILEVLRQRRGE